MANGRSPAVWLRLRTPLPESAWYSRLKGLWENNGVTI